MYDTIKGVIINNPLLSQARKSNICVHKPFFIMCSKQHFTHEIVGPRHDIINILIADFLIDVSYIIATITCNLRYV